MIDGDGRCVKTCFWFFTWVEGRQYVAKSCDTAGAQAQDPEVREVIERDCPACGGRVFVETDPACHSRATDRTHSGPTQDPAGDSEALKTAPEVSSDAGFRERRGGAEERT